MTALFRKPRLIQWVAFCLAFSMAMVPAPAGADNSDCFGKWRFEVATPTHENEAMVSPQSWCRAATLPRTFTAEIAVGPDGRLTITGSPQPPTDFLNRWTGRCEFQFAGPVRGRQYDDITIEVNASGAVVKGNARCMERTMRSKEETSAVGISLAVTGSHSPGAGTPIPTRPHVVVPGSDKLAAGVVAACRQRDADALWKSMTPRFRSEVDDRAAQVRHIAGSDLRRLFGYKGRPTDFDGLAYLRVTLKRDDPSMNMCWHANDWKPGSAVATSGGYVVPVERHDVASGLTFTKNNGGWQLDQMSKWVALPKP